VPRFNRLRQGRITAECYNFGDAWRKTAGSLVSTPRRQRHIQGTGLELFLTERGDAGRPTVVLIHGFPDTSAVWEPVADLLATDFHVVTYDVRGAGRSDVPRRRADYALPVLVADLAAVVHAVSPGAPVHLVAHDWGSIQGWEAVTTGRLAHYFASYTSISGPPIDQAGLWMRRHLTRHPADLRLVARQALHSWYVAYFHLPLLPKIASGGGRTQRLWASALHRVEGAATDATWPAPTFGADFAHGVELYRANIRERFRHPTVGHTDLPVQVIIPTKDRYVLPALLDGLETWTALMWKRPVDAGHWVIRTNPNDVTGWIREVIDFVEDGSESATLQRSRVA
jgi:pimeloyl-ACP methyl ester carboxylesterase